MAISVFGSEWTWLAIVPRGLSIACRTVPPLLLCGLCVISKALQLRGCPAPTRRALYAYIAAFTAALCVPYLLTLQTVIRDASQTRDTFVSIGQAMICGLIGCEVGRSKGALVRTLSALAALLALLSVYMFAMPDLQAGTPLPTLAVGFPMRLFMLFGLCWYTYKIFTAPTSTLGSLCGLVCCSLQVFVAFHKPIVFSGIGSLLAVFLFSCRAQGLIGRSLKRAATILAFAVISIYVVNWFTDGEFIEKRTHMFYRDYLHDSVLGDQVNMDFWTVEHSAGGRFDLWRNALERIRDNPWFGSGFTQQLEITGSEATHVHNGILDLMIAIGAIGSIPVCLLAALWWSNISFSQEVRDITIPIAAYVIGIAFYNFGGSSRVFFSLHSFVFFLMGTALGVSLAPRVVQRNVHVRMARNVFFSLARSQQRAMETSRVI